MKPTAREPTTPVQPTVVTTPTYPLYANDEFDVNVYNYETYNAGDVSSLSFTATYDPNVVTYVSFTQNSNFKTFSEYTGVTEEVSFASSGLAETAVGTMNSFFRYATLRLRVSGSQVTTSGVSTGISVFFTSLANEGNNNVFQHHYSSVYDFRHESTHGGSQSGESAIAGGSTGFIHIKVVGANDRAAFLHPDPLYASTQDHGKLFNYRSIDGQNHDNIFAATVITDRMSSTETGTALQWTGIESTSSMIQRAASSCTATSGLNYN